MLTITGEIIKKKKVSYGLFVPELKVVQGHTDGSVPLKRSCITTWLKLRSGVLALSPGSAEVKSFHEVSWNACENTYELGLRTS